MCVFSYNGMDLDLGTLPKNIGLEFGSPNRAGSEVSYGLMCGV